MSNSRSAAFFAALIASLSIGTSSDSQSSRGAKQPGFDPATQGELGYVTYGKIVLYPAHPILNQAAAAAAAASSKELKKWQTCMNGWDLRFLGGSRWDVQHYRRFPEQYCGEKPAEVDVSQTEKFTVNAVEFSVSQGRRLGQKLSTFRFSTSGPAALPSSERYGGQCVVLTNAIGEPIPVRSASSGDAFTFSNPYRAADDPVAAAKKRSQDATSALEDLTEKLNAANNTLASSRAWNGKSCIKPPAGALPPRPATLSDAQIETVSKGFCMELLSRRQGQATVYQAMKQIFLDDYITAHAAWKKGARAQCAVNMESQTNDAISLFFRGIPMAQAGMIQEAAKRCYAVADAQCRAPLGVWEEKVRAIRAGPEAELQQCQSALSDRRQATAGLPAARQVAAEAAEALQATPVPSEPLRVPLSEARCTN